ncbi:MobV family relaxase [Clostridium butyricum]|uniref:Recombinase n=1 Tax=Clostridium butyricum TaxID=1492 RepID=A0A2S7FCX0_CLOBU|nr:MobV family relaxase [Clostridium butyricum]KHD14957.1 hypothetical protein OA81_12710 [Clostridium butyricum]PPV16020.1 hypothetical protein AWN73_10740 [Clostridium butyricum]
MSKKIYSDDDENNDKGEQEYIKANHDSPYGLECKDSANKNYVHEESSNINLDKYNKHVGDYSQKYFCVFRIGKKIKYMEQVCMFEKHMERDMEVPNADPELSKYNRILIGSKNIQSDVREYIYGIKLRINANIGVDLVLTTGKDFFKNMNEEDKEQWIQENIKFLKENFGGNCIYACLHLDETTPHIHALIVPRFWNQEKNRYELKSNLYFDGIDKMRDWQDKYAKNMKCKFNNLIRGVRGSKANHIDIKTYYSLLNQKLNIKDHSQVVAYAKGNYLLEKRIKALEKTIEAMSANQNTVKLINKIEKLDKNNKIYKEVIKSLCKTYKISEKEVYAIIEKIEGKSNKNEREK